MKEATFYLDAWKITKALSLPLTSIYKVGVSSYLIPEDVEEAAEAKKEALEYAAIKEVEPCPHP